MWTLEGCQGVRVNATPVRGAVEGKCSAEADTMAQTHRQLEQRKPQAILPGFLAHRRQTGYSADCSA